MASSDSSQAKNLRNRPGRVNLLSRVYEKVMRTPRKKSPS